MNSFDEALERVQKTYGKMSVIKGDSSEVVDIESIPTGSLLLDRALGIGGIPRGRIIEIYGPESSGKTTLALHMCANAQKVGKVVFIDAENALDLKYARNIGVNTDELYFSQPDSGEEALEIADAFIRTNECSLIVIDSVAALVPKSELEGEMGDAHMGLQARLMSQAMRKLTGIASKTKCAIVFINQLRSKIGIMFGNPETTTGGNALKFYAAVRLDIRRRDKILVGQEIIGNKVKIKVVKNKVATPFKEIETSIVFGKGVNYAKELLDLNIESGKIKKSGSWFTFPSGDKIQGEETALEIIRENTEEYAV